MSDFFSQYPLVNPLQRKRGRKNLPTTAFLINIQYQNLPLLFSTPKTKSFFEKYNIF